MRISGERLRRAARWTAGDGTDIGGVAKKTRWVRPCSLVHASISAAASSPPCHLRPGASPRRDTLLATTRRDNAEIQGETPRGAAAASRVARRRPSCGSTSRSVRFWEEWSPGAGDRVGDGAGDPRDGRVGAWKLARAGGRRADGGRHRLHRDRGRSGRSRPGEVGVRTNRLTGGVSLLHEGWVVDLRSARAPPLPPARPDLPPRAERPRGGRSTIPDGRGALHRRRRRGALRARPDAGHHGLAGATGRRGARAGRADRRRRAPPDVREEHRARDLLDEARRHPEANRGRAQACARTGRHRRARRFSRERRPARPSTGRDSSRCCPKSCRPRRCDTRSS